MHENEIRALFSKHGIKYTRQRSAIYGILARAETPLTVEEIFMECKKASVDASLSTIYRILDTFLDKGFALLAGNEGKKSTYEINSHKHQHHLICLKCRKRIAIDHCPLEKYEKSLQKSTDFEITDHKLDIFGYCPSCK